ncbi:MAG: hypothetical protein PHP44_07195 [Kiritimatiellae bacterium]|nr:hypothetical protein [Kiritimatiellia bacterium]
MPTIDSNQSTKDTTGLSSDSGSEYAATSRRMPQGADRQSRLLGGEGIASSAAPIMNAAAPSALQRIWM